MYQKLIRIFTGSVFLLAAVACTPTVKVATPEEPITINLNVKVLTVIRT